MERVNIVKLVITPSVIPNGRLFPLPEDADKTIGNNGQMHGAKIVTSPAKNAKKRRMTMNLFLCNGYGHYFTTLFLIGKGIFGKLTGKKNPGSV